MATPATLIIHTVNVGQGDGAFFEFKDKDSEDPMPLHIIDVGMQCGPMEEYFNTHFKTRIENKELELSTVVVTHWDTDHYLGLVDLATKEEPAYLTGSSIHAPWVPVTSPSSKGKLASLLRVYEDKVFDCSDFLSWHFDYTMDNGRKKDFAKVCNGHVSEWRIVCVSANSQAAGNNAKSLGFIFQHGKTRYYTAGDLTNKEEIAIIKDMENKHYNELPLTGMKISHHGSFSSSSKTFLNATDPLFAVISHGDHKQYRHPNTKIMKRLIEHDSIRRIYLMCEPAWANEPKHSTLLDKANNKDKVRVARDGFKQTCSDSQITVRYESSGYNCTDIFDSCDREVTFKKVKVKKGREHPPSSNNVNDNLEKFGFPKFDHKTVNLDELAMQAMGGAPLPTCLMQLFEGAVLAKCETDVENQRESVNFKKELPLNLSLGVMIVNEVRFELNHAVGFYLHSYSLRIKAEAQLGQKTVDTYIFLSTPDIIVSIIGNAVSFDEVIRSITNKTPAITTQVSKTVRCEQTPGLKIVEQLCLALSDKERPKSLSLNLTEEAKLQSLRASFQLKLLESIDMEFRASYSFSTEATTVTGTATDKMKLFDLCGTLRIGLDAEVFGLDIRERILKHFEYAASHHVILSMTLHDTKEPKLSLTANAVFKNEFIWNFEERDLTLTEFSLNYAMESEATISIAYVTDVGGKAVTGIASYNKGKLVLSDDPDWIVEKISAMTASQSESEQLPPKEEKRGYSFKPCTPYEVTAKAAATVAGKVRGLFIGIGYSGEYDEDDDNCDGSGDGTDTDMSEWTDWSPLNGPKHDVNAILKTLEDIQFPLKEAAILVEGSTNPNHCPPTLRNIFKALDWLVSGCEEGDVLFLYYSGHSSQNPSKPGIVAPGGIIIDIMMELRKRNLFKIKGIRITAVFDSCEPTSIPRQMRYDVGISSKKVFHDDHYQNENESPAGVLIFSSCNFGEASHQNKNQTRGLFSIQFQKVLKENSNLSQKFTIREFFRKIQNNVKSQQKGQVPQLFCSKKFDLQQPFGLVSMIQTIEPTK